ncbi:hypothetical protein RZS08_51415, partial [Arthrospira platensis SPKY1]|nr:hypothetical protein [Arthrospira platensis SPKY1]
IIFIWYTFDGQNHFTFMKNIFYFMIITIILSSCDSGKEKELKQNPFLSASETPYGIPPFDQISLGDYIPAFKEGFQAHLKEIDNIIHDREAPSFDNTIVAFERSGELLNK